MNLLVDDTRLGPDEYREAFNVRNRFDVLDQIRTAKELLSPSGRKQGIFTFGDYILLFVEGFCYYQLRDQDGAWQLVDEFHMRTVTAKVYTVVVPVNTTNYWRLSAATANGASADAAGRPTIQTNPAIGTVAFGNVSGVLVQNGIDQPWFIWVDSTGSVRARETKKYSDWSFDPNGTDNREYVPVGTIMEWWMGALHVVSPDSETIYRSVTGRPLDFVINVNLTGQKADTEAQGGAASTSYSVGVGGITCLRAMSDGSLFVACSNVICFAVTIDRSNNARTLWGEPTFIRQTLFNAGCVNERSIVDVLGDTAFVDVDGLRSYNAVQQYQNEGRNSVFSLKVAALFKGVSQANATTATISFDNYALFSVYTIYGYAIIVYDTLNQCYSSIDLQTEGMAIKQFAKIELTTTRLYCITAEDKVLQLYAGTQNDGVTPKYANSVVRMQSMCASLMYNNNTIKMQCPTSEIRLKEFRAVLNGYRQNSTATISVFVDNKLSVEADTKQVKYLPSTSGFPTSYADTDSGVYNALWTVTDAAQGWKSFVVLQWTGGGSITNIYAMLEDIKPRTSLKAQANQLTTTVTT